MKALAKLFTALVLLAFAVASCAPTNQTTEMTTNAVKPVGNNPTSADEAAISNLITTMFSATDARQWDQVENVFADEVIVDYSDLGSERATKSPDDIVDGWQAVLPGFERTIHQPHNYAIWIAGDRATATYDALALHYLEGQEWTVFAGYDSEFIKQNGEWKINKVVLSLYDQKGNKQLAQQAMKKAKDGATPRPSAGNANTRRVDEWFAALDRGDVDGYLSYIDQNGVQRMPLAPENFPKAVSGTAELRKQYAPVHDFASQNYDRTIYPTSNPNIVLVKFTGNINVDGTNEYNNSYISKVDFNDAGKILEYTEFFNPQILISGFPGLKPLHYSVHEAGASPSSGVELREIEFMSEGDRLVGHLFLPPNFNANQQYPSVIVTGSWTSVKEQMPDEYASLLAKDGFVAMTFDFRGFGESEGLPRGYEDYNRKIKDIRNAATYLLGQNFTNQDMSGLGVCASSGYMAHAVAQDDRFTKLTLIAPWLHNAKMTEELYASRPGGRAALLKMGKDARKAYESTGEIRYDQAVSEINELAAMYVPNGVFPYYLDPAMAAGKHYANVWAVMSWEPWLTFDGISAAKDIDVPVHIVHSESGAVPQGAKDFIELLPNEPEVLWLNDYNQQDLYFVPEAVQPAMSSTSAWLRKKAG